MPTLDRIATSSVSPDANAARLEGAGVYLTNEVFLYRVIEVLPSEEGEMVELEDCYGLDVVTRSARRGEYASAAARDALVRSGLMHQSEQ